MKILSKKIVIRNGSLRMVALLCCIIGVYAVWNWKNESNEAVFEVQIQPEISKTQAEILEKIIQERDLSNYELGETFSDCAEIKGFNQCVKLLYKGREFIYEHLKNKKRGYIVYQWSGVDCGGNMHIFIEPDHKGIWHIIRRMSSISRESLYSYNIESVSATSIKRRRKTEDGYRQRTGTYHLVFLDKNGEEVFYL